MLAQFNEVRAHKVCMDNAPTRNTCLLCMNFVSKFFPEPLVFEPGSATVGLEMLDSIL